MSERNRQDPRRSKQADLRGSRPNSAHAGGRGTTDPYYSSQPAVEQRFGDQSMTDPRFSGQAAPSQQLIPRPHRSQRSDVPQHTHYPSFSGQATPNHRGIADPYHGQPILEVTSSGQTGPYFGSQPTADPRFSDPSITEQRFIGQTTPYQQRNINSYGGRPIPRATPGGYASPYSSSQPAFDPRFDHQSITDPRFSDRLTPYQERITDLYAGHGFPVSQPTPYPSFSGQATSNQQRIANPYHGQLTPEATTSGQRTPDPPPGDQLIKDGIYIITNVYHGRFVYLEDANDTTPLRGHFNDENRSAQWHVRPRGNKQYSMKNVEHDRYADSGNRAEVQDHVEGSSKEQLWRIQALPTGEYTIATTDTRNLWILPSDIADTPVELFNVHTDRRCWWTLEQLEIGAPANEHAKTPLSEQLPLVPSGGQPTPEAALLEFTSVITEAIDLLNPLRAACGALRAVLQKAEGIGHVNEDLKALIERLKFHLATVKVHVAQLEEDQEIDKTIPALTQGVRESLDSYASELKEILELLLVNRPENSSLENTATSTTRKIDEAFQKYTTALHHFAAITVDQMRQQLAQFRQESENAHITAENTRLNRPNAYGIQHRECLQGTREKTLPAIGAWADDENTEKWIFFFLDVAGSGKSTVAKHMAEKWKRENRLLARFFFSRDTTETMSTSLFCSTVANTFAILDPEFKKHMDEFADRPDLELLPFEDLFGVLVACPLRAIGQRAIIVIDALDECHPEQRDQMLETFRTQHSSIPLLRVFVTGRPERDIKRWADDEFGFGYTNFIRLEESDKDVRTYIEHMLKGHSIAQGRLYPVIRNAEGLFIWARVACDLLLKTVDIDGLLEELGEEVSLDYLYKVALEQSTPKEGASRRAMVLVLQMILAAREPLSIAELEMLSPRRGVVENVITCLSSVLLYQGREDPIRLLHATFREFLTTRSKADIFFIQPELGHHTLASGCLNTINHLSKQDDTTLRNVDGISNRKSISYFGKIPIDSVSRMFRYSSESWVYHCLESYRKLALNERILGFANNGLKTWIDLVDKWQGVNTVGCVRYVLLLSHQNMASFVTTPNQDLTVLSASPSYGNTGISGSKSSTST